MLMFEVIINCSASLMDGTVDSTVMFHRQDFWQTFFSWTFQKEHQMSGGRLLIGLREKEISESVLLTTILLNKVTHILWMKKKIHYFYLMKT